MGFFDAFLNGFEMTKTSISIAIKEPWMILLPLISAVIMLLLIAGFLLMIFGFAIFGGSANGTSPAIDFFALTMIAGIYFTGYFLTYFTQAMIIFGAKERLEGRDPAIGQAFACAMEHIFQIIILAIIGSTIGVITNMLANRKNSQNNVILTILSSIIGIAWIVLSYFALPVIISEKKNVFEAFKRSGEITFQVWGEGLVANFSLFIIYLPGIVLFFLFLIGAVIGFFNISLILLGFSVLAVVIGFFVSIPVKAIISQALYTYALRKQTPSGFDAAQLENAFIRKGNL